MKKLIYLPVCLGMLFFSAACENWFDVSPKSDVKAEGFVPTGKRFSGCVDRCLFVDVCSRKLRTSAFIRLCGCAGAVL